MIQPLEEILWNIYQQKNDKLKKEQYKYHVKYDKKSQSQRI